MVTLKKNDTENTLSFMGLSTDTKPTVKYNEMPIINGSTFFAMDTQECYFYDGSTDTWLAQP